MLMSKEQKKFLGKQKKERFFILFWQMMIVLLFFFGWEMFANHKIINPFIFSSPSRIFLTLQGLFVSGQLFTHIWATLCETIIAFLLGISLGFGIALLLYEFPLFAKIIEPFLTMLNSLPKVALGPIIIIWTGANGKSIIVMALLINLIISILTIYNGFVATDEVKIKLMKSLHANQLQMLWYLVIPSAWDTIISSLKLNISMTFIGVIMGEFLVSKKGIGYLIIYGTQVFNLNLVMSGIFILIVLSFFIYECVSFIEKKLSHR